MPKKMNRTIVTLRDIIVVLVGAILAPWAIYRWSEVGFRIEPKFYAGTKEGNAFFVVALLGVAMVLYGIFNLLLVQRRSINEDTNGPNAKNDGNNSQRS